MKKEENTEPKIVYQYTNINALALILKNKTIRFSVASSVDDRREFTKTADCGDVSDYVYISSWTSYEDENIALWNMYSKDMSGVRIRLPSDMFTFNKEDREDSFENNNNIFFYFKSFEVTYKKDYLPNYTLELPNSSGFYHPDELCKNKDSIWIFQQEFRYRLFGYNNDNNIYKNNYDNFIASIKKDNKPTVKYVDIPLKTNIMKNMQILLGPKSKPGAKEIVEALVNTYIEKPNNVKIEKSHLSIQ